MKLLILFLSAWIVLGSSAAQACGGWIFRDLKGKKEISFLVGSLVLLAPMKPHPKFMTAGPEGAHFIQGSRVKFSGDEILYSTLERKAKDGKRRFKTRRIGTYSGDSLKLDSGETYRIAFVSERLDGIDVYQGEEKLEGGVFTSSFAGCDNEKRGQLVRVALYYVWKSLNLNPYDPLADNGWW